MIEVVAERARTAEEILQYFTLKFPDYGYTLEDCKELALREEEWLQGSRQKPDSRRPTLQQYRLIYEDAIGVDFYSWQVHRRFMRTQNGMPDPALTSSFREWTKPSPAPHETADLTPVAAEEKTRPRNRFTQLVKSMPHTD